MMPTASSVPSAWKPPTRFITTSARNAMCAGPPARLTERRKPGSTHSSTSGRQISASTISDNAGDADDQQQRRIVHRQHRAEQEMQEIDVAALERDDGDAERERNQEERGERGVLLQFGRARDQARADRDDEAREQAETGHREQTQPEQQEADRRARQDRMRHGVADQAHAPQHQEHADRRGAERERKRADQRAAHELEFDEWSDEEVVDHRPCRGITAAQDSEDEPRAPSPSPGGGGSTTSRTKLSEVVGVG